MGHHSDPQVAQPISADQALAAKLAQVRGALTSQLSLDFAALAGVPLPSPAGSTFQQTELDLIAVTTPLVQVVQGYESGALALVAQSTLPVSVQGVAGDVVRGLTGYVSAAGGITTGGYACSAVARQAGASWCCALFCEVEYGTAAAWGVPVDFHQLLYAFVVWDVTLPASGLDGPNTLEPTHWTPPPAHPPH